MQNNYVILALNYIHEDTYYIKKRRKKIYKERKRKKERNEIIRKA